MKSAAIALFTVALLFPAGAQAQQQPPTEEQELRDLMAVLAQETGIATKARMNSDYVPGIVTVLEGDELEALGFETVGDALAMVPGVQAVRDSAANASVIVRGIHFPFNSGNIKILVDGVPLSRESAGLNGSTLLMPIENVERIEFIRGPGSVIYGDFAFMGLVNIITRRERVRVYFRPDSAETLTAGVGFGHGTATSPWQFGGRISGWNDNRFEFNNRIGDDDRRAAGAWLRHGKLSFSGNLIDREVIDRTGTPGPALAGKETSWALEGNYSRQLSKTLAVTITATALDSHLIGGTSDYDDRIFKGGIDFQWKGLRRQSWLAAIEASSLKIDAIRRPPPNNPNAPALVVDGEMRKVVSATLQDQIDLNDHVSVTAGARFDRYSDLGSRVTPRLSFVWRASDHHIIKGQYAEGFRAPTFFELFGGGSINTGLEFEANETTELNYVYRRPGTVARATVFHSQLRHMIFGGLPGGRFGNTRGAHANGLEVEWTQQLTGMVKLMANVATVKTGDNRGLTLAEHESEAAADWMSDVAVLVRPVERTLVGLHWNHVGPRQVVQGPAYDLVDLTVTRQDLFFGLGVRGGIRNLADEDVRYLNVAPNGTVNATIGQGRTVWVQLSWRR